MSDVMVHFFVRYPEPGRAKTRLIPALGADAAAGLHKRLAERCAHMLEEWLRSGRGRVTVNHTGASEARMREWLGDSFDYREQSDGDLGARLGDAFRASFARNAKKVIAIGADAPELSTHLLEEAVEALEHRSVVVGPARDGGYYLIGLRAIRPELFRNITWGSGNVLQETLAKLNPTEVSLLPELDDIDRPEDLGLLDRAGIPLPATGRGSTGTSR